LSKLKPTLGYEEEEEEEEEDIRQGYCRDNSALNGR
jgi:hypothetical protein